MSQPHTATGTREPGETTPLLNGGRGTGYTSTSHQNGDAVSPSSSPPNGQGDNEDAQSLPLSHLAPILATIWVPVFVASLDGTVVATLVGSISSSFQASEQAAWLGTSYLLSLCCFNPLVGRLADVFGRRITLLVSIALFTLGTLGCGAAPSFKWFLIARIVAGAGGGGLSE